MASDDATSPDLTRNQTLVLQALETADAPLSAYVLLDRLRDEGFRAPLQVYRALDKLVAQGRVHRLESLSAFVACQHPDCENHATTVFMICEKCGKVSERSDGRIGRDVEVLARDENFAVHKSSIELRGLCGKC